MDLRTLDELVEIKRHLYFWAQFKAAAGLLFARLRALRPLSLNATLGRRALRWASATER